MASELRARLGARLGETLSAGGRVLPEEALPVGRTPSVTVVVPCYNYGRYLAECAHSILDQPGVEVDMLIVDDASPDGSGDVAQRMVAADPRIGLIRHEVNRGHIQTYNDGLAQAKGDYVVLLSADDLLAPGALGRATALMEAHPDVGLVYGNPRVFQDDAVPQAQQRVRDWTVWPGPAWIAAQSRRGMSCIYSPEAVLRNAVQREVGGYDPALPHSGDLEMWLRVAAVANVGRVNGPDQAFRREHAASMMHTTFAAEIDDLRERLRAYDSFFTGAGARMPGTPAARKAAHRRLAQEAIALANTAARRGDSDQAVQAYLSFARDTYPAVEELWQWQEQLFLQSAGPALSPADRARSAAWLGRHDLEGRLRWRRWHWSGV